MSDNRPSIHLPGRGTLHRRSRRTLALTPVASVLAVELCSLFAAGSASLNAFFYHLLPAPYSILVNTCDSYADCWGPFFTLFRRYWPDCPAPILLNTERLVFNDVLGRVESAQVWSHGQSRLSWGECLRRCLAQVSSPLILYLQEDYFLDERVDTLRLGALAQYAIDHPLVAQIGLTAFGARPPFLPTEDPRLWRVGDRSKYRISLQAAFWRTNILRSYVRSDENAWMFEIYGTRRSWRRNDLFLTVNREAERHSRAFPYRNAGLVKGKWEASVPRFFESEGIAIDFNRRGFFHPRPRLLDKLRTVRKLVAAPRALARGLLGK